MQCDKVGFGQQGFQAVDLARRTEGHDVEDVVEDDAHIERLCEDRELRADVAIAHDAECFASEFPAAFGDFIPCACAELIGSLEELTRKRNEFANDELCYGTRV